MRPRPDRQDDEVPLVRHRIPAGLPANRDVPIGPGTPTIVVNGHNIDDGLYGVNFDANLFRLLVEDLHKHPNTWDTVYKPLKEKAEAAAS